MCIDAVCDTKQYHPEYLILISSPNRQKIRTIEVTMLDNGRTVRVIRGSNLDLPPPKKSKSPCGCHARNLAYDAKTGRFLIDRT